MAMKQYSEQELIGYLLWCLALLMDDVENILKTHPNNKPLQTLSKEEFAVENADQTMAIIGGQLDDMGLDYDKLIKFGKNYKLPDIKELLILSKKST